MPAPAVAAALIGAGSSILQNVGNFLGIKSANQQNQEFQMEMYQQQRRNALADWQMQNQYNSPAAQMERLKAAGLNPNLVYDNGAANTAMAVRSNEPASYRAEAPRFDFNQLGNSMMQYVDARLKSAQTDNVNAATKVAAQEAALKAVQTAGQVIQNSRSSFELQQAKDLKTIAIDQAKANLASTTANTGVLLARNEREAALNSQTLDKGVQEILNLKKQRGYTDVQMEEANKRIELLKKDGVLKDWEIALSKLGLTKTDPAYRDWETDRKSTRLNSSHRSLSRMPSSA